MVKKPLIRISLFLALTMILASCRGIVDVDLCSGEDNKVAHVTVLPNAWTLKVGDSISFNASVVNSSGNWNLCLKRASWQSSDTTVAVVHEPAFFLEAYKVVGVRSGKAYIRATSGKMSDSVALSVVP